MRSRHLFWSSPIILDHLARDSSRKRSANFSCGTDGFHYLGFDGGPAGVFIFGDLNFVGYHPDAGDPFNLKKTFCEWVLVRRFRPWERKPCAGRNHLPVQNENNRVFLSSGLNCNFQRHNNFLNLMIGLMIVEPCPQLQIQFPGRIVADIRRPSIGLRFPLAWQRNQGPRIILRQRACPVSCLGHKPGRLSSKAHGWWPGRFPQSGVWRK